MGLRRTSAGWAAYRASRSRRRAPHCHSLRRPKLHRELRHGVRGGREGRCSHGHDLHGRDGFLGRDEETCLFFPPGDEAMCAYQIGRLLGDVDLAGGCRRVRAPRRRPGMTASASRTTSLGFMMRLSVGGQRVIFRCAVRRRPVARASEPAGPSRFPPGADRRWGSFLIVLGQRHYDDEPIPGLAP